MTNTLRRLQDWYEANCSGDWDHTYGVSVENIDNPGWMIKVDLVDTYLQNATFRSIGYQNKDENDWIHCSRDQVKFTAVGGPQKLEELLVIFLDWAEKTGAEPISQRLIWLDLNRSL